MSKYAFRWAVAILVTIMFSLLSVIGKQSPEQRAKQAQGTPAVAAQTAPAKPIDPIASYEEYKREAEKRRRREEKWEYVQRNPGAFCESFRTELQQLTGIKDPCLK